MRAPKTTRLETIDQAYRLLRSDVEENERKTGSAMPTTGSYSKGQFVWNTEPAIDGSNMVLLGWSRLTTGSAHVLNTDWAPCYTSTVSPAT